MPLSSPAIMRWVVLLAAILVWVNLYSFITRTTTLSAPLMIEHLAPGLGLAEPITTVTATVNGGLRDIAKISDQNLQFALDANGVATPGHYHLKIIAQLVPVHIQIISIVPSELDVNAEPLTSKTLTVVAYSQHAPNDQYSIDSLIPSPAQVTVTGAPTLLAQLSDARVNVDVSGRRASFSTSAEVLVLDGQDRPTHSVSAEPSHVQVTVNLIKGTSVRNLGLLPSFSGDLPGGFWVQEVKFDPAVVQVRGSQKSLDALTFLVSTPITLTNHRSSFNDQVAVDLPNGIGLVGENLIMAHITLGSSEGTRQLDIIPQYVNVTEGFSVAAVQPTSIQVVISGDPKTINQLKRQDVKLNLDLQGALSGSNQITITPAMFALPSNFQVVSFAPNQATVVLNRL